MVTGLVVEDARVSGIRTYFGSSYAAGAVVLTAGTFLSAGEQAAERLKEGRPGGAGLSDGSPQNRHPGTGQPAQQHLGQLEEQPSDAEGRFFSFDPTSGVRSEQINTTSPAPPPPLTSRSVRSWPPPRAQPLP